ncbi:hypothetical protein R5W23_006442 [Gemmata sp. JC673]|uniref:Uncharacterized protein n=1 Tax=Gemmata algarum TaxID=2975278 RepID=A0ABU5EVG3_9BACT|nr:hypothetical protein [Gemmata algarum]MDY3559224.1 hypothetical protein [Gemmata algarum]
MRRSLTVLAAATALTWPLPVVPAHRMKSAPGRDDFPFRVGTTCDGDGDGKRAYV